MSRYLHVNETAEEARSEVFSWDAPFRPREEPLTSQLLGPPHQRESSDDGNSSIASFQVQDWGHRTDPVIARLQEVERYLLTIRSRVDVNKLEVHQAQEAAAMVRRQLELYQKENTLKGDALEQKFIGHLQRQRQVNKQDWEDQQRTLTQRITTLESDLHSTGSLVNGLKKGLLYQVERSAKERHQLEQRMKILEQPIPLPKKASNGPLILVLVWLLALTYLYFQTGSISREINPLT